MESDLSAHTPPHAGEYKGSDIQEDPAPIAALFDPSAQDVASSGIPRNGLDTEPAVSELGW